MATRDGRAQQQHAGRASVQGHGRKPGQTDVFASHGNSFLRDRAAEHDQDIKKSPLDAALQHGPDREPQLDPPQKANTAITERQAIDEVIRAIEQMAVEPETLRELLETAQTHEERASRVLEHIVEEELDPEYINALADYTLAGVSEGMVIASDAFRAVQDSTPLVQTLGEAGAVLWQLLDEAMEHYGPADTHEAVAFDASRIVRAFQPVVATLRL